MNYETKTKQKNLMMFPVLIGKTKILKHIHTFRRKKDGLTISISKC